MSNLNEEQARAYMHKLLGAMSKAGGSDLFIAHDFPPSIKLNGRMQPLIAQKLTGEVTERLARLRDKRSVAEVGPNTVTP